MVRDVSGGQNSIRHLAYRHGHGLDILRESDGALYPAIQAVGRGMELPETGAKVDPHMLGLEYPVASGTVRYTRRLCLQETFGTGNAARIERQRMVVLDLV